MVSRPLALENGRILLPYGGIYVVYLHTDSPDKSNLEVELRAGISYELFSSATLQTSIHFGDRTMLFVGINKNL